jgi:hypothetical protein
MGFLNNVSISNDYWHTIAKDPQKLIEGISWAMNEGTNSPLRDALDAKRDSENRRLYNFVLRQLVPQGVVVHHARHYDEPQIIVNTYGSQAIPAHEIASAISHGWLDLNRYKREHAERVATLLEQEAKCIREALKENE